MSVITKNSSGVDFVSADNGGLTLTSNNDVLWSRDVAELAAFVVEKGLAPSVMGSSSMDFAEEYGFDHNDAAAEAWNSVLVLAEKFAADCLV